MTTPPFIVSLRERIGHELLWLSGVTAVVVDPLPEGRVGVGTPASGSDLPVVEPVGGDVRVLMVRRADNGAWTPVTGIIDPGEQPAIAAAREVSEETSIVAEPVCLARVHTLPPMRYDNGDRSQYLDLTFLCRYVSGDPFPADGENTEAAWYPVGGLPRMEDDMRERVAAALAAYPGAPARFDLTR